MDGISAPTYRQLLEIALELGRSDGRFAASFEAPGSTDGHSGRCLGRSPGEFARLLWGRPDEPPTGLEVNAPLWYAAGFAEGLEEEAAEGCAGTRGPRIRRAFT